MKKQFKKKLLILLPEIIDIDKIVNKGLLKQLIILKKIKKMKKLKKMKKIKKMKKLKKLK